MKMKETKNKGMGGNCSGKMGSASSGVHKEMEPKAYVKGFKSGKAGSKK